jgi:hypothetical protein
MGQAQEVMISGFPPGVGGDIDPGFLEPYYSQLSALADTLEKYPLSVAVVTGSADGLRYLKNNDAKNPGLAAGRAMMLRNLLVNKFGIDSTRILVQSIYAAEKGGQHRYAAVRVARELADLESRVDLLESRPSVEKHITEVREIFHEKIENMGIQLSAGISSSPFGGIPIAAGAITWKRFIFIEGIFGHTLWNDTYRIEDDNLNTRRRMTGGLISIYPLPDIPVGAVGGWLRVEEISQRYNEYVKMSEGPAIGFRIVPHKFVSITAVQNTAKHNIAGVARSRLKDNQFLFFVTVNLLFGGGK